MKKFFRFLFRPVQKVWSAVPERVRAPLLWLATWCTTTIVGYVFYSEGSLARALWFSVPLMTILTCHELGHYFTLRRYAIPSSLPYFIPVPFPPFGTFGAVMSVRGKFPNRRALFDVGVNGPLAGLAATVIFMILGLYMSTTAPTPPAGDMGGLILGAPILLQVLARIIFGAPENAPFVLAHPCAVAAWVGLFLTALNLMPMGQLDGGHASYAMFRKKALILTVATLVVFCMIAVAFRFWGWFVLATLVYAFGFKHPSTCDDAQPLGRLRAITGTLTLAFLLVGFTPLPLDFDESPTPGASGVAKAEKGLYEFRIDVGKLARISR